MVARAPEGAGSSSAAPPPPRRQIESIVLHYRMPLSRSKFVDDVTKPWVLACHGMCKPWTAACDNRTACKAAAKRAGSTTTAMLHTADPREVMEAGLTLTALSQLDKKSRERLAEHGPADRSWQAALGLAAKDGAAPQTSKRVRR